MEIGFLYQKNDPQQVKARNYLRRYVRERGILAKIIETDKKVTTPTIIINGHSLKDRRRRARTLESGRRSVYPTPAVIADALDAFIWSV